MTYRGKSDSQLDAEAFTVRQMQRHPLIRWQSAAHAEPPMRLTGRHPALIVDEDNTALIEASQVGVDFTAELIEYIDGSRYHRYLVHDALLQWDRECRRRHSRWPDHRGRPVCAEMVRLIIFGGASLLYCSEHLGISYPRAERLLLAAVDWMRRRQERWLGDGEASASHDREYCAVCRARAV
jgi:hypothetical protein